MLTITAGQTTEPNWLDFVLKTQKSKKIFLTSACVVIICLFMYVNSYHKYLYTLIKLDKILDDIKTRTRHKNIKIILTCDLQNVILIILKVFSSKKIQENSSYLVTKL